MSYSKTKLAPIVARRLKCCTEDQFRLWLTLALASYERADGLLHTFCGDCTHEYRREMESLGNCVRPPHFSDGDYEELLSDA